MCCTVEPSMRQQQQQVKKHEKCQMHDPNGPQDFYFYKLKFLSPACQYILVKTLDPCVLNPPIIMY